MPRTVPVARRARRRLFLERLEDRLAPAGVGTVINALGGIPDTPAVVDLSSSTWYLRNEVSAGTPDAGVFSFGMSGWVPVVGDWTGTGHDGIGVVDLKTETWYLRTEDSPGPADAGVFQYGAPGWRPVVGDWTGTGHAGIGVVDPATSTWYLRNEVGPGAPDAGQFQYGMPGWTPVVGDWSGAGHAGVGVLDPATSTWYLRNEAGPGAPDAGQFQYGIPGWTPVVGDWTGAGHAGVGVVDPVTNTWFLRNEVGPGAPDAGSFPYGTPGFVPLAGKFQSPGNTLVTLNLKPLDINLLGLEVRTSTITVNVSAQPGQGQLLGNLLTDVSKLINLQGVNNALNNVLDSVVNLLDSASLTVSGVDTTGSLGTAAAATTPVLDLFVAPVHLNLLGAQVDTSPIHLTITAHSGNGLVLGNVITDLANLFNPPLPAKLDLDTINAKLTDLLSQLNAQIPGIGSAPTTPTTIPAGTDEVLRLTVAPINVNLLGLILQTSQIQVNADAQTGNGLLLGNVLTTLLNTLGATPQNLSTLNDNLNALLAKVIGVLNATSLTLPSGAVGSLSQVLQTLALPDLVNKSGTPTTATILNLAIASSDSSPPVDVNLLGLVVTTSNIRAQLLAQTGDGQVLGNLLFNVANLLNPGGALGLLPILTELAL